MNIGGVESTLTNHQKRLRCEGLVSDPNSTDTLGCIHVDYDAEKAGEDKRLRRNSESDDSVLQFWLGLDFDDSETDVSKPDDLEPDDPEYDADNECDLCHRYKKEVTDLLLHVKEVEKSTDGNLFFIQGNFRLFIKEFRAKLINIIDEYEKLKIQNPHCSSIHDGDYKKINDFIEYYIKYYQCFIDK